VGVQAPVAPSRKIEGRGGGEQASTEARLIPPLALDTIRARR